MSFLPLNDGTQGFRFRFGKVKGLYRKRAFLKRKLALTTQGDTTVALHMGKRSLYVEYRPLRKFADWVK
jgi:hypothetical protein